MTTNNHPAHGPVSLDRLHQISEILSKAAAQSDGGNLGYAMADAVKVIDVAIAAFGADPQRNPVLAYADSYRDMAERGIESIPVWSVITDLERNIAPLYTSPQAQVSVPFAIYEEGFEKALSVLNETLDDCGDSERGLLLALDKAGIEVLSDDCCASILQDGNFREIPDSSTNNCREISETSTNEHEIETHTLLKSIEGMEVSVDVSTCDEDAGNRYFGTVTEISELGTAKNGYILLVQDAKPNFKQAGNSPVIGIDMASEPDRSVEVRYLAPPGYAMVPKVVTPEIGNAINEVGQRCTCGNCSQRLWDLLLAAAPQQEVKSALEHGMQRYAGAMQKLSEGDK